MSGIPALLLLSALLALWWDFGGVHAFHQSDSLVPVMMSLWKWTPFYWGEDRFGTPVAALAIPFQGPLANLLVQNWLTALLGLLGLMLLPACVLPGKHFLAMGAASAALFTALTPPSLLRDWLGTGQCYGTAMGLGAAGLALLAGRERPGKPRLAASFLLIIAAVWVNSAAALILVPLALGGLHSGADRPRTRLTGAAAGALAAVAGTLGVWFILRPFLFRHAYFVTPLSEWPGAWGRLAWGALRDGLGFPRAALLAAAFASGIALLPAALRRNRAEARETVRGSGFLLAAALAWLLGTGMSATIAGSGGAFRYAVPALALVISSAAVLLLGAAVAARRVRGSAFPATLAALVVAFAVRSGFPSPGRPRADLDRSLGADTSDIIRLGVTHVSGNYSLVWPAVFHANLILRERGEARTVWAIAPRARPTRAMWRKGKPDDWRVAVFRTDPGRFSELAFQRLVPAGELAHTDRLIVIRPREEAGRKIRK